MEKFFAVTPTGDGCIAAGAVAEVKIKGEG